MVRFVFVHGPWQLLLASSALRHASGSGHGDGRDILVLFSLHGGPVSAPLRDSLARIAGVVWDWDQIVDLQGIVPWGLADRAGGIEALRAAMPDESPDEVWLDCLWGAPEKIIAEAYPGSRLVLIEDGLHTYLEQPDESLIAGRLLRDPRGFARSLKLRVRERRQPDSLSLAPMLPRHVARVSASYLWITLMIPPAVYQRRLPIVQLPTDCVRETLERVAPLVDDVRLEPGGPRALVLGQCFSNYGDLTREVERDCYVDMVRRLQEKGYEVVWKEHPRTRSPFLPELMRAVPGLRGAPDWGPWPVELFVERLGLSACASITSTALFTIPILFGLPTFSPAARLVPAFRFPNDALARLVENAIPSL